jgi:hypothetical protein
VSAISTCTIVFALLAQQPSQQQESDRVGAVPPNGGSSPAPTMRDGIGSVFALSSLTGGNGQGSIFGGTMQGTTDIFGTGNSTGLGGMNGIAGAPAMPMGGISGAMGGGAFGGAHTGRGAAGFHSPSRHLAGSKLGLAAHGKGKASSKFDLVGARSPTTDLNGLLKGLLAAGPLTPEEATMIVHALVAADSPGVKDPNARASLRQAREQMLAPASSAASAALQSKMDELLPAPPDAPARTLDEDTLHAWFGALDASNDGAISFLEWRDRTGLGLDVFRQVDTSGEGLLQFEELERTLVANAVAENRSVDAALLDKLHPEGAIAPAAADEPVAGAVKPEPIPQPPLDELLKQVRALLSRAASQQSALASDVAAKAQGGAGGTAAGKGGAKKGNAKGKAASAAPSPFDLLGTAPNPAKKTPPKKPVPHAGYQPSGGN